MRRFAFVVAALGLATSLVTSHARAETPAAPDDVPPYSPPEFLSAPPELPASTDASNVWRLDLAEAIQLAVKSNLRIVLERQTVRGDELGIDLATGAFEPLLTAGYNHTSSTSPPSNLNQGTPGSLIRSVDDNWQLSLTHHLETGTQLSLGITTGRATSTSGNALGPKDFLSVISVGVTQPIARNFSLDRTIQRIDILRAQIASDRERRQLAVTVTAVVESTEDAYWDLVRAIHNYDLTLRSEKLAEDQLALSHRQIDAGLLPPSDLIVAESTVAQRQLSVVQSEQIIESAGDVLRAQLNLPRDQWSRPILPIDTARFVPETTSADDGLALAIKHRPELAQADLDEASAALSVRKADNDKRPEVDLGVGASLIGEGSAFDDEVHQVGTTDAKSWQVLASVSWTPLNRVASVAAQVARVQQKSTAIQREALVQQIWLDVRDAVRNQRSTARLVIAAAKSRELAEKTLEIEQRRFLTGQGQSSNFLIAQRQQELAAAQVSELGAVLDHQKASAALLRSTGQLLDARHIELTN